MSYQAGIGVSLGAAFNRPAHGPRIICDGCGQVYRIPEWPPKWFLDRKPPRGWRGLRTHDGSKRWDLCPRCWEPVPQISEDDDRESL